MQQSLIRDRWIDLRADRCLTPSGTEVSLYYVLNYPDWVHIVALTPERDVLLVRQYRHGAGLSLLGLPAGTVDGSDDGVEGAARRELAEETGYFSDRWLSAGALYPNPAIQTNRVHTFLALDAVPRHEQKLDEGEEGLTLSSMPLAEILPALDRGLFSQAMHVASMFLAARLIETL